MQDLNKCPLCGGDPKMVEENHDYSNGEHTVTYQVECTKCLLKQYALQDRDSVVESWNQRYIGEYLRR